MKKVILTGNDLTLEQIGEVVFHNAVVEISPEAEQRIQKSRQLVFDLADADFPIYGFNVGVGWNKDKKVFNEFFEQYNSNLIRSHCIGVPPYASEEETRAAIIARLNAMLTGCCGVAPAIAHAYADLLNNQIHPLIPERGSVGQADIGLLSHIGLALIGEGNVVYKGEVMPSTEAFEKVGMQLVAMGPKDGLAIVSSNALGAGQGAIALLELEELLKLADLAYAMSLEGINGNVTPLDDRSHVLRKYKGQRATAKAIRKLLEGSYLNDEPDPNKAVHDPLSYRNVPQIHGAVRELLDYTKERLEIHVNSTDDNPCVLVDEGTIIASANFEPLNWVLGMQSLSVALSHVSKASCLRMIKISNPDFSGLPRFLSPRVEVIGYGTVQKTYTSLDVEIRHLSNPCSVDGLSLAGDMEDISSNSPLVVQNLRKIIDNLRYILALELMHAAQAMDYRKDKTFGSGTKKAFDTLRKTLPFYDKDHNITADIEAVYQLIKSNAFEQ